MPLLTIITPPCNPRLHDVIQYKNAGLHFLSLVVKLESVNVS